jgi:hypothetical protein
MLAMAKGLHPPRSISCQPGSTVASDPVLFVIKEVEQKKLAFGSQAGIFTASVR